jgi:transposase
MVQLKYETIRAVQVNGRPIAQAALDSGLSRPTIYEARQNFRQEGIEGLLPEKRGPKKPRKLTPQVRGYLEELVALDPDLKAGVLVQRVRRRFGVLLHVRTVEKALQKKAPETVKNQATLQQEAQRWTRRYEQLREQVLARGALIDTDSRGLSLLIRQGVAAWMRAWQDPLSCCCAPELGAENRPMIPPDSWQQKATRLLVNMALSHLRTRPCNS